MLHAYVRTFYMDLKYKKNHACLNLLFERNKQALKMFSLSLASVSLRMTNERFWSTIYIIKLLRCHIVHQICIHVIPELAGEYRDLHVVIDRIKKIAFLKQSVWHFELASIKRLFTDYERILLQIFISHIISLIGGANLQL